MRFFSVALLGSCGDAERRREVAARFEYTMAVGSC